MVHIGVDYGRRRTGLAMEGQGVVLPLEPVLSSTWEKIAGRLSNLREEQGELLVVLGLPLTPSGRGTELSAETEALAAFLIGRGFVVELQRETSSTREAEELRKGSRDGRTDSVAAGFILKRFLGLP
jgi:RNase H-fold protein (predicted Holliday junction resolvase)